LNSGESWGGLLKYGYIKPYMILLNASCALLFPNGIKIKQTFFEEGNPAGTPHLPKPPVKALTV
jgi:hypothetical protein